MFFTTIAMTVSEIVKNSQNKEQPNLNVSAAYTITDESSLSSNYDSYNEFHINSPDGLKAFANSVYSYTGFDHSFAGKTIVLKSDIDLGGALISIGVTKSLGSGQYYITTDPTFKGTFDGNGKTISNYQINGGVSLGGYSISGGASFQASLSLFPIVTGTIKNLKVSNVTTISGASGNSGGHTIAYQSAIVAMLNGGTITNCVVDGFSGAIYGAGIVAASYDGKVNNCYATNISATYEYGIGPNIDKAYKNNSSVQFTYFTCTLSNCVTTENAVSILSTVTNCHTTANTTTGLDLSNIWYYNSSYSEWPYLRVFMEFSTFKFDTNGDGTYDQTREVPADAAQTTLSEIYRDETQATIYFLYANAVTRGDIPPGKHFVKWILTGSGGVNSNGSHKEYSYEAVFEDDLYGIYLYRPQIEYDDVDAIVRINGGEAITLNDETTDTNIEPCIKYGDSITAEVNYAYGKMYITYYIGSVTIEYEVANGYCLEDYGMSDNLEIEEGKTTTVPDIRYGFNIWIQPDVQEKTYTPNFG